MEEKNQNQEVELSALQMQYKTLQEKFNQQEIVNNDLIHEMLHSKIANFKRRNWEIVLTYGLLAAAVCWSWYCFELRFSFMIISVLLFILLGLFELLSCRKVLKINTEDADIQTLIQKMKDAQTRFSLIWITGVLALCLWMMWFVTELGTKHAIVYLRPSFIIVAAILTISIILIISHIDRLAKMSNELVETMHAPFLQTAQLNGSETAETPTYRRGRAYWSGVVLLMLSLVGLVFKLMHWPFASLIYMAAGISGVVFVLLTGNHLSRIVPEERPVIRIAEIACMFLIASAAFGLFHWPFGNLFGIISLLLILIAALVYWLRHRRDGKRNETE